MQSFDVIDDGLLDTWIETSQVESDYSRQHSQCIVLTV